MFDEYGVTDRIVNENSQIRNVNQDLRFNDHVTRTRNNMEKYQRTVKVLDFGVDNSFPNSTVPFAIIATTKDKKIEIEKIMLASAKKVVFE